MDAVRVLAQWIALVLRIALRDFPWAAPDSALPSIATETESDITVIQNRPGHKLSG